MHLYIKILVEWSRLFIVFHIEGSLSLSSCWESCLLSKYTVRNYKIGMLLHKDFVFNVGEHKGPSMESNL